MSAIELQVDFQSGLPAADGPQQAGKGQPRTWQHSDVVEQKGAAWKSSGPAGSAGEALRTSSAQDARRFWKQVDRCESL